MKKYKKIDIGRNAPCPCGSGKKYKKCCYLKEQNVISENSANPQGLFPNKSDDLFLARAFHNFHKIALEKKDHIKEYYRARKLHGEIIESMLQYYEDGKFNFKTDTTVVPKDSHEPTPHLMASEFDLETNAGMQGFYDLIIYKSSPTMNCITEDFIRNHRYRRPEKNDLLHSMLNSTLGLFEVIDTDSSEGYATLKDVFTGTSHTIIDVGLSGSQNYNEFYIYTRIINYNNISFGTGLNFIFSKTDRFIKDHIQHYKKDYNPDKEIIRFTQLYNQYSKYPNKVNVVANTLN